MNNNLIHLNHNNHDNQKKDHIEDDNKESVAHLVEHRLPWLALGLLGGLFATFIVSKFEGVLSGDLRLAFFIPIIVYMSDAVGTQTETIYVRHLRERGKIHFWKYILKETGLGISLGTIFGAGISIFALYWLHSAHVALTVGLAMGINVALAPILATIIPALLYREHADPALGSGPLATIIQDLLSLLIYFSVASIIIF